MEKIEQLKYVKFEENKIILFIKLLKCSWVLDSFKSVDIQQRLIIINPPLDLDNHMILIITKNIIIILRKSRIYL